MGAPFLLVPIAISVAACDVDSGGNGTANEAKAAATANEAAEAPNMSGEAGNAVEGQQAAATAAAGSILAWSRPAAGSTVAAPVSELVFHFSPPARLIEVTVTGAEGATPMMVTAVGEEEHYSLPLSDLGPGRYTVDWRASRSGVDHRGSFAFDVK